MNDLALAPTDSRRYFYAMLKISNWNNYPIVNARMQSFGQVEQAQELIASNEHTIARGMGRSYKNASLYSHITSELHHNSITHFDESTGWVTCHAGVLLKELLDVFVPRGWFLPVTPGTKFVSVSGAIAADVHGKNHHKDGSFCLHVEAMTLALANGEIVTCSRHERCDLFELTCGGMGLTDIILDATIQLRSIETAYIREEIIEATDLATIMYLFQSSADWTYSVAWIDCMAKGRQLGRSLMMRGEHATIHELPHPDQKTSPLTLPLKHTFSVPFNFPTFILNGMSVSAFNRIYYHKHAGGRIRRVVDYNTFFYPLDFVHHWNRIYGGRGFLQYQLVLPESTSYDGIVEILRRISRRRWGSFLAVLKLFGKQDSLLSFPMEGYTLALDFPLRDGLFQFLDELDTIVTRNGGRIYLAKDARMKKDIFYEGYPRAQEFIHSLRQWNPDFKFRSNLTERLGITL